MSSTPAPLRAQNVLGAAAAPGVGIVIAAAVAWDARWTVVAAAALLLDAAVAVALALSGRVTSPRPAAAFVILQLDLFAAAMLLIAFVAGGRVPSLGAGLLLLALLGGLAGHAGRHRVLAELRQPRSWLGRAFSLVPVLAFGGAMAGSAIGRRLGPLPVVATLLLAGIAFYVALVGHASWARVEAASGGAGQVP